MALSSDGAGTLAAGQGGSVGGAEMAVYDVNGDGLNDIVTSLGAHGWGLAWFEQKRDKSGAISFVEHMIMDDYSTKNAGDVTFSELHALTVADIDGDGVPDIVTGKRLFSHQESYTDPDPYGPAVLYWYRTVRNPKAPGGAEFVPELIHNRSGVGSTVLAVDLNKDGADGYRDFHQSGNVYFLGQTYGADSRGEIDGGQAMNRRAFSGTLLAAALSSSSHAANKLSLHIGHTGLTWLPLGGGPGSCGLRPAVDPMADPQYVEAGTFAILPDLVSMESSFSGIQIEAMEAHGGVGALLEKYKLPLISAYCGANLSDPAQRKSHRRRENAPLGKAGEVSTAAR